MRSTRAPGVAELADDLPLLDLVSCPHRDAARLEMGVEGVAPVAQIEGDVVAFGDPRGAGPETLYR